MASFANDNSERYIPEKDFKEAILIKTPRPENFDPVKKLDGYLQEILKQTKRPQDIAIDNILENAQDKVLDIMGPLPKLWLMVEQVNSGSRSSSIVEIDTVLELLEKTVLLIRQYNNTTAYARRKNVLLGVTRTSSSQVSSILKEKAAFLHKHYHYQALFGKYFRDHLTKILKAKKQSIGAIAEDSKSTNRKRPFREDPSFYQGRRNGGRDGGGQKFRANYNGKYILLQHCVKCVQIRTRNKSVFGHFSRSAKERNPFATTAKFHFQL